MENHHSIEVRKYHNYSYNPNENSMKIPIIMTLKKIFFHDNE